jgi:hypothetical protein
MLLRYQKLINTTKLMEDLWQKMLDVVLIAKKVCVNS